MNLATIVELYAGGVGSGCNPAAGRCGRPPKGYDYNSDGKLVKIRIGTTPGTFYHGTNLKYALKVFKRGLTPTAAPKNYSISAKGYVYVTKSREAAGFYADFVKGGRSGVAVIRMQLPAKLAAQFEKDPNDTKAAWRFAGKIPSKYITAVDVFQKGDQTATIYKDKTVYRNQDWGTSRTVTHSGSTVYDPSNIPRMRSAAVETVYMPYLGNLLDLLKYVGWHKTDAVQAGGPGSGCRGSNCGRPQGDGGRRYTAQQRQRLINRFSTKTPKIIPGLTKQGVIEKGEPLRKGLVRTQFLTNEGAHYTLIKSPRAHGEVNRNPLSGKSQYKGQFRHEMQVPGYDKTRLADVLNTNKDAKGRGQTLIVHRDYGKSRVVIQEFTHEDNHIVREREYKMKSFGKAMGFLNSRYGVRLALPKRGWNR